LGHFVNIRKKINYEKFHVLFDITEFSFGKIYEIEVDNINFVSDFLEDIQEKFENIFYNLNIKFEYSKYSKFERFLQKE
jgi:hypothetical protein